jgi:hypothetical protein
MSSAGGTAHPPASPPDAQPPLAAAAGPLPAAPCDSPRLAAMAAARSASSSPPAPAAAGRRGGCRQFMVKFMVGRRQRVGAGDCHCSWVRSGQQCPRHTLPTPAPAAAQSCPHPNTRRPCAHTHAPRSPPPHPPDPQAPPPPPPGRRATLPPAPALANAFSRALATRPRWRAVAASACAARASSGDSQRPTPSPPAPPSSCGGGRSPRTCSVPRHWAGGRQRCTAGAAPHQGAWPGNLQPAESCWSKPIGPPHHFHLALPSPPLPLYTPKITSPPPHPPQRWCSPGPAGCPGRQPGRSRSAAQGQGTGCRHTAGTDASGGPGVCSRLPRR